MKNETEDEYPSIREALSNDSKVANAYCGVKYAIWQVGYLLFTVIGGAATLLLGLLFGILIVAEKLYEALKTATAPITRRIKAALPDSERVNAAGSRVSTAIENGHEKSKETPGVRRLWGECPVTISREPKWFETLTNKVEQTGDKLFR